MEPISKKRFAAMVRIWINHKKIIAEYSYSKHYKNMDILKSFSKIHSLLQMVKRDCNSYNLSDLCSLILRNESDLRNILPAINNDSYQTQVEKLESILTTAKTYKK